jgi:enoyl-CoA hydratase
MFVTVSIENHIATLTIHRPEALNALNAQVMSELETQLATLKTQFPDKVRGLIITGGGEKAFVAGADIKEISALTGHDAVHFAERGQRIFRCIEFLPFPVIAAVNGFALGGGLELALSCDFIYAAETAKVGLPETNLGLIPGFGGCVRLSRVVGLNRAREIVFSATPITASEAFAMGLVNKVFPKPELLPAAVATLTNIMSKGPMAIRAAKKAILEAHDLAVDAALAFEAKTFGDLCDGAETKEGTLAFLEKRKPKYTPLA